jgi:hypothetical protein
VPDYILSSSSAGSASNWEAGSTWDGAEQLGLFQAVLQNVSTCDTFNKPRLTGLQHNGILGGYLDKGYKIVLEERVRLCHLQTFAHSSHLPQARALQAAST